MNDSTHRQACAAACSAHRFFLTNPKILLPLQDMHLILIGALRGTIVRRDFSRQLVFAHIPTHVRFSLLETQCKHE